MVIHLAEAAAPFALIGVVVGAISGLGLGADRIRREWAVRVYCSRGIHEWSNKWSYIPMNTGGRVVVRCLHCGAEEPDGN